jgi:hypothetical protein
MGRVIGGMVSGMDQSIKTRENRLRRAAERQGLALRKSRTRDPRALTYGRYWLTDGTGVATWSTAAGVTLDQIEQELNS